MHALNEWIGRNGNSLANAGAFIMTFLLMWFIAEAAQPIQAAGVAPAVYTQDVFVLSKDAAGGWHNRVGKIEKFPGSSVLVCFEIPEQVPVSCFFINKGKTTSDLVDMKLVGEEQV